MFGNALALSLGSLPLGIELAACRLFEQRAPLGFRAGPGAGFLLEFLLGVLPRALLGSGTSAALDFSPRTHFGLDPGLLVCDLPCRRFGLFTRHPFGILAGTGSIGFGRLALGFLTCPLLGLRARVEARLAQRPQHAGEIEVVDRGDTAGRRRHQHRHNDFLDEAQIGKLPQLKQQFLVGDATELLLEIVETGTTIDQTEQLEQLPGQASRLVLDLEQTLAGLGEGSGLVHACLGNRKTEAACPWIKEVAACHRYGRPACTSRL